MGANELMFSCMTTWCWHLYYATNNYSGGVSLKHYTPCPQNLQPDYSMESHSHDLENYVNVARNKRRRAKALLDFERHDDDELGFRKNDIITVSAMFF